ncbi:DNase I-like protein, partial [Trametes cingulata]
MRRVQAAANTTNNITDLGNLLAHGNLRLGGAGRAGSPNVESGPDEGAAEIGDNAPPVPAPDTTGEASERVAEGRGDVRPPPSGAGRSVGHFPNNETRNPISKTKMKFIMATLNMRGLGPTTGTDGAGKWLLINQLMREERIGLLAVQETHLNDSKVESLKRLFGQNLDFFISADPVNPTGARGVAFVLNKKILNVTECQAPEVIPGRAMTLAFRWKSDRVVRALNVYGPNERAENSAFWDAVRTADIGRIDAMLGDFNITEQPMDRLPARQDHEAAASSLSELLRSKDMLDGWRETYPNTRAFSYLQASTGSQSRIDRIYVKRGATSDYDGWMMKETGVPTDHKLVLVTVANRSAPFAGKGRWTMPLHLLADADMKREMLALGARLVDGIERITERTDTVNPQVLYASFKKRLTETARNRAKIKVPKMERRIRRLRDELEKLLNASGARGNGEQEVDLQSAAVLQERIGALEAKRFGWSRMNAAAKHWTHGETVSRYWLRSN